MDEDSIPSVDSLFEMDDFQQEAQYFLLLGKYSTYKDLKQDFPQDLGYELIHAGGPEDASLYLMEREILIVFLDLQDERLNPITISNALRHTNPHVRIVVISPRIKSKHLSDIYNLGSITGYLETPYSTKSLMKIISEQEARYSIDKMVTAFVQEPPKLSKASFLLLDPTLTFDEGAPVNFVGLMIVGSTVPKFTQWFEETLSQDEYLLAGYLSSITALGNDLFNNQEALREINFGGISVIFRFHGSLQFSFLVKNLTKHNFETGEERISELVNQIVDKYGDTLEGGFLSESEEKDLERLAIDFDLQDEEGIEISEEVESIFSMPESIVLLYGNNEFQQQYLINELIKLNSEETDYDTMSLDFNIISTTEEEEAVNLIRNRNCDVVLIDTNLTRGRSPDDFADFAKEMKPLISVIVLESHEYASETLVSAINNDTIEFVMPSDDTPSEIMNYVLKGMIRSRTLTEKASASDELENSRDSLAIAKMKLRENLESFDQEEQPLLHGLIITLEMKQIYDRFWEDVEFDKEMISGLVESLKNVGGEMFTEEEKIDGLELAGTTIFVREQMSYLFIYFVKNVTPNTSVVIAKEVDTVTSLFSEVISESAGMIPIEELTPFFDKIAIKAHYSFTEILSELDRDGESNEDFGLSKPEELGEPKQPDEISTSQLELRTGETSPPQTSDTINVPQIEEDAPQTSNLPIPQIEEDVPQTSNVPIPQIEEDVPQTSNLPTPQIEEDVPQTSNVPIPQIEDNLIKGPNEEQSEVPSPVVTSNPPQVPSVEESTTDHSVGSVITPVPNVPSVPTPKFDHVEEETVEDTVRVDNLTDNAKRLNIPKVPSIPDKEKSENEEQTTDEDGSS